MTRNTPVENIEDLVGLTIISVEHSDPCFTMYLSGNKVFRLEADTDYDGKVIDIAGARYLLCSEKFQLGLMTKEEIDKKVKSDTAIRLAAKEAKELAELERLKAKYEQ